MDNLTHDDPDVIDCDNCDHEVALWSSLENRCENCGALYNGLGQRLRESRRSALAHEQGRDPGVPMR
jgi:hypothetical protein